MRRIALYMVVALTTLGLGNSISVVFGWLASLPAKEMSHIDYTDENRILDVYPRIENEVFVISMTDKGDLYLGKTPVGSESDTTELRALLAHKLVQCEKTVVQTQPVYITAEILQKKECRKIVYIAASESVRFGAVEKLIEAAKASGAEQVDLISRPGV